MTFFGTRSENEEKKVVLAGIATVAILLSGCSFLGDSNNTKPTPMVLQNASAACFDGAGSTIREYVDGNATLAQMDTLVDCTINAASEFAKKVRGTTAPDTYTEEDISNFIEHFLSPNKGSFDRHLAELFFTLKASSIGGKNGEVSRSEIYKLQDLLRDIKISLHEINPYVGILSQRERIDATDPTQRAHLEDAIRAFDVVTGRIATHFNTKNGAEFTVDQAFELMSTLGLNQNLLNYKDVVASAKSMLIGGSEQSVASSEWQSVLKTMSQTYGIWLRSKNVIEPLQLGDPAAAPSYHHIADEVTTLIQKAINVQPSGELSNAQLNSLIDKWGVAKLLPFDIKAASLKALLPAILNKAFRNFQSNGSSVKPATGFGLSQFEVLKYYLSNWLHGHDLMIKFGKQATVANSDLASMIGSELTSEEIKQDNSSAGTMRLTVDKEYKELFMTGRPFSWTEEHRFIVAPVNHVPDVASGDLARLNIYRLAVELALRAYAEDESRAQSLAGLKESEVQKIYLDLKGVGIDVGFVDPRNPDAGKRTFMEIGLFTSVSNGNDLIEFRETTEWFATALSSSTHADDIFKDIVAICGPDGSKDIFDHEQVKLGCFRKEFFNSFDKYFSNLPLMVRYVRSDLRDPTKWTQFMVAVENASRPKGSVDEPMDVSSLRAMITVLHYDESIMARFDKDGNQKLNDQEIWTAFPIIKGFISKLASPPATPVIERGECKPKLPELPLPPGIADWKLVQSAVFAYLIREGKPPPTSLWQRAVLIPWAAIASRFTSDNLDRTGIVKIIASFSELGRQTQQTDIQQFYASQMTTLPFDYANGTCSVVERSMEVFRCDPSALPTLVVFLKAHNQEIFAQPKMTAAQFGRRLENLIQSDEVMHKLCLPF